MGLEDHPELIRQTERITAQALAELAESDNPPLVVDIRTPKEWQDAHIQQSINLPLNQLVERRAELPKDRPIVVHCQGGYRSSIAASLLEQHGFERVSDLVGGFKAWSASRLPYIGAA